MPSWPRSRRARRPRRPRAARAPRGGSWTGSARRSSPRSAARTPAGALLVDDLQWADEATLRLLGYLLRRLAGRPVLVLLTWRLPRDGRLRRALADAERTSGAQVHALGRLGPGEVADLVRSAQTPPATSAAAGGAPPARPGPDDLPSGSSPRRRACRSCWSSTWRRSATPPEGGADEAWPLPAGAQALIRARVDALGELGRQVLAAAAVLGRSFDADALRDRRAAATTRRWPALEELVARGLVGEERRACAFGHEKVRALVYDDTEPRPAAAAAPPGRRRTRAPRPAARTARAPGGPAISSAAGQAAPRPLVHARAGRARPRGLRQRRRPRAPTAPRSPSVTPTARAAHGRRGVQTLLGDYAGALASYETAAPEAAPAAVAGLEQRLGRGAPPARGMGARRGAPAHRAGGAPAADREARAGCRPS